MNSDQARRTVSVAALQMACTENRADNLQKAIGFIEQVAKLGTKIVCLQELFTNRYFCQSEDHQYFDLAESIPGPTTERLCALARAHDIVIIAGLFERRAAGVFHNSAVVIDGDGQLAGIYRKMHIPDDPYYFEKFYFTPGDLGFRSFATPHGQLGVCICWDQWFPEAARLTAMRGAEILVYPTAIGWLAQDKLRFGPSQLNAWQTMMRSHAIANGVFVVAPNRVGQEGQIEFWGSSFICDPYGNVLAEASPSEDQTIVAECDLHEIQQARTHWPFLRDRRIDSYQQLGQRWIDASP